MEFPITPRWPNNRWFNNWLDDEEWLPSKTRYSGLTVSEDAEAVYVEAALPGVNPDAIEVTVDKGTLSLRGSVEKEEKDEKKRYYRRASQSFAYQVDLPIEADASKEPDVTYKDGMLHVTFRKSKETQQPRKIAVKRG